MLRGTTESVQVCFCVVVSILLYDQYKSNIPSMVVINTCCPALTHQSTHAELSFPCCSLSLHHSVILYLSSVHLAFFSWISVSRSSPVILLVTAVPVSPPPLPPCPLPAAAVMLIDPAFTLSTD